MTLGFDIAALRICYNIVMAMWPSGYRRISAKDITPVRFWTWPP